MIVHLATIGGSFIGPPIQGGLKDRQNCRTRRKESHFSNNGSIKDSSRRLLQCFSCIAGLGLMLTGQVAAQTFTTLHSFNRGNGTFPGAGLILSGSSLYGTAQHGGSSTKSIRHPEKFRCL